MNKAVRAVTVVGLGRMGLALAGAVARAGHTVTVWNRTASRAEPLRDLGVAVAESVASACSASDVVLVCLADYDATRTVLNEGGGGAGSALEGRCLVQVTSGTPSEARELAEWAAARGVEYIDAKILCYPAAVGTPDAALLCSGSAAAFEAVKPVLAALSAEPLHVGDDPGHAATIDLALLINSMSVYVANMTGRAICEAEGLAPETWNFVSETMYGLAPALIRAQNTLLDTKDFSGEEATLTTWAHTADLIHVELEARQLDTTLAASIAALARRTIEHGHGADGFASIYEVVTTGSE
jgi:3-hydroxyisobutyrate dehydrogenase-like beta-hydroxyacid dehydrogenase